MSRWYHDIHKAMKRSANLFDPRLGLKWKYFGTHVELRQGNKVLWHSHKNDGGWLYSYDYWGLSNIAAMLHNYQSLTIDEIKGVEWAKEPQRRGWVIRDSPEIKINLFNILTAADRRVGKNWLSVRLFVEPNPAIRNIIGARL